jgi:predicted metal-binding membrane protein
VTTSAPRRRVSLGPAGLAALLLGGALVGWIVTADRMQGMEAGPGMDLGGLGWYVGIWLTMMSAMMLPSAAPMVIVFSRMAHARAETTRGASAATAAFVGGYFAVWTLYGLVAYAVFRALRALDLGLLSWDSQGPIVAGAAIVGAGLYQLTPLQRACLRHCRSPLHFLMHSWRPGPVGAFRLGGVHGGYCVGCCAGLMLVLFALGVMSVLWMAVIAAIVFAEKVLPFGRRGRIALAAGLVAAGIWVAAAPGGVPGLHEPGSKDGGMSMTR